MQPVHACNHDWTTHLFKDPFCESNSLETKVEIIAFHILTCLIPLLVYLAGECLGFISPPVAPIADSDSEIDDPFAEIGNALTVIQEPENEELEVLKESLPEHAVGNISELIESRVLIPYDLSSGITPIFRGKLRPHTALIGPSQEYLFDMQKMVSVYFEKLRALHAEFPELTVEALHERNPWHDPDFQEKVYELLEISYCLSLYTIDDLVEANTRDHFFNCKSACASLKNPSHYSSHFIYLFSSVYHHIRCGDVLTRKEGEAYPRFHPALSLQLPPPNPWGDEQFESHDYGEPAENIEASFHVKCRVLFLVFTKQLREKFAEAELRQEGLDRLLRWYPTAFPPRYAISLHHTRPHDILYS